MASIFDRIENNVEYITWRDVYRVGFRDSQSIAPWYRYSIPVKAGTRGLSPSLGIVFEEMACFFPERKANPYIGPVQDCPAVLRYKVNVGDVDYKEIENPTTEDLELVMGIIQLAVEKIEQ